MKNKLEFLSQNLAHRWEKWQAAERTHYTWDKFATIQTPHWYWDKFNASQVTQYKWNKSSVQEDTQHIWGKYNRIDTLERTDYNWEKHNTNIIPRYPSWEKDEIDQDQIYVWDKYEAVIDSEASATQTGQLDYTYTDGGTTLLRAGYKTIPSGSITRVNRRERAPQDIYVEGRYAHRYSQRTYFVDGESISRSKYVNAWYTFPPHIYVCGGWENDSKSSSGNLYNGKVRWTSKANHPLFEIQQYSRSSYSYRTPICKQSVSVPYPTVDDYTRYDWIRDYGTIYYKDCGNSLHNAIQAVLDEGYPCAYIVVTAGSAGETGTYLDRAYMPGVPEWVDCIQVFHSDYSMETTSTNYHKDKNGATTPGEGYARYACMAWNGVLTPLYEITGYDSRTHSPKYVWFETPEGSQLQTYCGHYYFKIHDNTSNYGYFIGHDNSLDTDPMIITNATPQALIPAANTDDASVTITAPGPNGGQKYYLGTTVGSAPITVTSMTINAAGEEIEDSQTTSWNCEELSSDFLFYREHGNGCIQYLQYEPGTVWVKGDYISDVRDKIRSTYPDNGKQEEYWYIYLRQQSVQPYLIQCVYMTEFDSTGWSQCSREPTFNTDTGNLNYKISSQGGPYYVNDLDENKNRYVRRLSSHAFLYWTSIANDGTPPYDYGSYVGDQRVDSQYFQQLDTQINEDHECGSYIARVTVSDNPSAHVQNGEEADGYWYIYKNSVPIINTTRGTYIEDIGYYNEYYYPLDGPMDDYWYTYKEYIIVRSAGQPEGVVKSQYINAYPVNGINNGAWYQYIGTETGYVKGNYLETLDTLSSTTYPEDGMSGYYWYTFKEYKVITEKGSQVGTEDNTDNYAFPEDGVLSNYWYVITGNYNRTDPTKYVTEVWSDSSSTYPSDGAQGDYYYKYIGYKARPEYIIDDTLLKGGVKYMVDINSAEDYAPGDVACAEIQFTIFAEPRDSQKYLNLECDYYERMEDTDSWNLVGHFKVLDASDRTSTTTSLKAYDNILKTEVDVDSVINSQVSYPIKLKNLFTAICTYCGCTGIWDESVVNGNFKFQNNFTINGITGRQVLSLIAEVAAGFIYADKDGNIVCRGYITNDNIDIDETSHTQSSQGIYTTQSIDKLNAAMSTDDIGVSVGSGDVVYRIIGNPILYAESASEIEPALTNIYNVLHASSYTPTEVKIIDPAGIGVGDKIDVNGYTVWVQGIEWDGTGVKITSKGKKERTIPTNPIDGSIDALRGKSNELTRTIEQTQSTITDVQAGLQSQITQTASTLNTRITNEKAALQSQITQTAGSITSTVEAYTDSSVAAAKTEIKQTTDSISSTVSSQGQTITSIQQDLNGITLSYNSSAGTASLTIGNVTISQLVDGNYVQRQVAGIDLTGYVTFHSLETAGQTTINGSNITTGTISANRINMTGAISWSDLSSSCQSTIAAYAGQDGQDGSDAQIPNYIKSTYIDAVRIVSPTIQGGTISAGTTADGYISMTSKGMNFVSSTGGSLIGMGYYSSYYNMPYITLGQGVDQAGTDKGLIKKFQHGLWIGDSDSINSNLPGAGCGIFINFTQNKIYKMVGGVTTEL